MQPEASDIERPATEELQQPQLSEESKPEPQAASVHSENRTLSAERPSNDELVDDLLKRAGGIRLFHVIVYVALGMGANVIRSFFVHFIPFLI